MTRVHRYTGTRVLLRFWKMRQVHRSAGSFAFLILHGEGCMSVFHCDTKRKKLRHRSDTDFSLYIIILVLYKLYIYYNIYIIPKRQDDIKIFSSCRKKQSQMHTFENANEPADLWTCPIENSKSTRVPAYPCTFLYRTE